MNLQQSFIDSVLLDMQGILSEKQLTALATTLTRKLFNYELVQVETKDLPATYDETNHLIVKRWLLAKTIQCASKNTIDIYAYRMRVFLSKIEKPIQDIQAEDIRYYLAMTKAETRCSNTSLENTRLCLSSFFKWCLTEEIIKKIQCLKYQQ